MLILGNSSLSRAAEVTEDRPDSIYPDLIIRLRAKPEVDPRYLVMSINSPSVRRQVEIAARTAVGTFKVNGETVKNLQLPVPALPEQIAIIEDCAIRTTGIQFSIDTSAREMELLREFRTRLTSDVVTGQVDVREIAATLPELTDETLGAADEFDGDDELIESELEFADAAE